MKNRLVRFNEVNQDYFYYDYFENKRCSSYNPKKSMLKFIETATELALTPKQKLYFNERFISGKTVKQIAEETGRDPSTVSREIKRARVKLQRFTQLY